jgi:serine phosphatase RsbU (regulator of sigma subunit)
MAKIPTSSSFKRNHAWPLQIAFLVALVLLLIGTAMTVSIHLNVHQDLLERLRAKGMEQVGRFSQLASEAMMTMDRLLMTNVIDTVMQQDASIIMAILVNHDGRIIVHSQSDQEGNLYRQPEGFLYLEDNTRQIMRCYINEVECLDFSQKIVLDRRIKGQSLTLGFAHIIYSIAEEKSLLRRSVINSSIIVLAGSLLAFWLCWLLLISVDNKIIRFNQLIEQASEGAWTDQEDQRLGGTSQELLQQFKQVQTSIQHTMSKQVKHAKQEQHEQLAKVIQNQLVPKTCPVSNGYDMAIYYQAGDPVGGDYLDIIQLDDHYWGLVVADIAGRGVSATVAMSQVRSFLRSASQYHLSPLKTLVTINRQLYKDRGESLLITMTYGVLDLAKGTLTFCRAGHPGTIICRHTSKHIEVEKPLGIAMGLASPETFDLKLAERKIKLLPGDCVMLYTDGIEKALDKTKALYKQKQIKTILTNNMAQSAKTIITLIDDAIQKKMQKKILDDRAILFIKVEELSKS